LHSIAASVPPFFQAHAPLKFAQHGLGGNRRFAFSFLPPTEETSGKGSSVFLRMPGGIVRLPPLSLGRRVTDPYLLPPRRKNVFFFPVFNTLSDPLSDRYISSPGITLGTQDPLSFLVRIRDSSFPHFGRDNKSRLYQTSHSTGFSTPSMRPLDPSPLLD